MIVPAFLLTLSCTMHFGKPLTMHSVKTTSTSEFLPIFESCWNIFPESVSFLHSLTIVPAVSVNTVVPAEWNSASPPPSSRPVVPICPSFSLFRQYRGAVSPPSAEHAADAEAEATAPTANTASRLNMINLILVISEPVSYTHLTLPTNRK